jgi:hypothetical protein
MVRTMFPRVVKVEKLAGPSRQLVALRTARDRGKWAWKIDGKLKLHRVNASTPARVSWLNFLPLERAAGSCVVEGCRI